MISFKDDFVAHILDLQTQICDALTTIDQQQTFGTEHWSRPEGGGGTTRTMQNGQIIEKAGVNTSQVFGTLPPSMMQYLDVPHPDFFACGISLVIHPRSPFVPTVHANYRYFEVYDADKNLMKNWFGGGSDLTPYYLFEEDAVHFHTILKAACDKIDTALYPKFKNQCDAYFVNHHRQEARGIGGIFFDRITNIAPNNQHSGYDFTKAMSETFLPSYIPIIQKRKDIIYKESHKTWQEIRRGRYVEFNLLHDKGTLFGLKTNGRIESILMSLPPTVQWQYDHTPTEGSEEQKLIAVLKNPKNWI